MANSRSVRLEWQFFEPFSQRHDLESRLFLTAIKIEHELQGFVRSQLIGVVPEAGSGAVVGGLHFDEPMHASVERHDEIHFATFFIAKVENFPALADRVLAKLSVFQQAAGDQVLELRASGFIVCGSTVEKINPAILSDAARQTVRVPVYD
jgi:hypothetical protein